MVSKKNEILKNMIDGVIYEHNNWTYEFENDKFMRRKGYEAIECNPLTWLDSDFRRLKEHMPKMSLMEAIEKCQMGDKKFKRRKSPIWLKVSWETTIHAVDSPYDSSLVLSQLSIRDIFANDYIIQDIQ